MTRKEVIRLFALIAAAYPRDRAFAEATPEMVTMWARMLADIPLQAVEGALAAHSSTSPFPPSIAEIRQWATGGAGGSSGVAAWGRIMEAMRKYGSYEPKKARACMGEEVWGVMQGVFPSWQHLCMSENMEADRAHFIKAWDSLKRQEKLRMQIPAEVRVLLQARAEKADISGLLEDA